MEAMREMINQETDSQYKENMLSWITALSSEFSQDYWTELQKFLKKEREEHPGKIFPPKKKVFTWMKYCSLDQIKVVIIGQDPYPGYGLAHGLCFSVEKKEQKPPEQPGQAPGLSYSVKKKEKWGQKPFSPPLSLKNIFEELARDPAIKDFKIPEHGDLTSWAEQGVLLLNAVLTIRLIEEKPHEKNKKEKKNFHKNKGWEEFTNRVVSLISERNYGVVFLLWGEDAKQKRPLINEENHDVRTSFHPSPLSAHRGFLGCGHFSKTNELLEGQKKKKIDWQI